MEIDKSKLTFHGSMNYLLQVKPKFGDPNMVTFDLYLPRKNRIHSDECYKEEIRPRVEEAMERMKIAIQLMQEYLDGTREEVYFWQEDNEDRERLLK